MEGGKPATARNATSAPASMTSASRVMAKVYLVSYASTSECAVETRYLTRQGLSRRLDNDHEFAPNGAPFPQIFGKRGRLSDDEFFVHFGEFTGDRNADDTRCM